MKGRLHDEIVNESYNGPRKEPVRRRLKDKREKYPRVSKRNLLLSVRKFLGRWS